jgi:hypothetical protein
MSSRVIVCAAAAWLTASVANAGTGCDAVSLSELRHTQSMVDSLRPEKPGQVRVFAGDGSEFTAGQAQWMKGQLREVEKLCAHGSAGDEAKAAQLLAEVDALLRSHQRKS